MFNLHKMTGTGFLILFGLNCVLVSCKGQVYPPYNERTIVILPGSTARLNWSFVGDPSIASLAWYFTKRGSSHEEELAAKFRTMAAIINNSSLPGVAVELPATLVLKNVDERYNGKYQFGVLVAGPRGKAEVDVFIAVAPNVTINCSSPAAVNEGNDFTCVCRGKGGNPPADVTWYKGTKKIGGTGKEEQTLSLKDVNRKTDNETYKCVAQSHINATDGKSITVIVNRIFKPENTKISFTPERAGVGRSFTITCNSRGVPEPSYSLTHNGTKISTNNTYTIHVVQYSDAGTYKCIARNKLGSDSASAYLAVVETPIVTINCSSRIAVDEGDNFTCICTSEGGNPPGSVTWYKDGKQIGYASYGENILTFTSVFKQSIGTYKCVAQSYTLTDEKSIEVKVRLNFKPMNTLITITPQQTVEVDESVTITCNSAGRPEPSYTITHNRTIVTIGKMYTISKSRLSNGGLYECTASNKLGRDSDSVYLNVKEASSDASSSSFPIGLIIPSVIGAVLLLVVIIDVVYRCKLSKKKDGGYRSSCFTGNADVRPVGSGGVGVNHYELDEEPDGGVDNAYDIVNNAGASGSKSKPPEYTTPDVYATVDKKNREDNR